MTAASMRIGRSGQPATGGTRYSMEGGSLRAGGTSRMAREFLNRARFFSQRASRLRWLRPIRRGQSQSSYHFPAGGADGYARAASWRTNMRASLGQSVIIENVKRWGGRQALAWGGVARAAPDGYTVSIGHWSTHVVNGAD